MTPPVTAALRVTSPAFAAGERIADRYTCTGEDVSPPVQWSTPPEGTKSMAVLMDDPDANNFGHWLVYNLPGNTTAVPEALPKTPELADGSRQGETSFGEVGYGGPCPPSGTHHYVFHVYALDTMLSLPAGASKDDLLRAMQDHVLAQGELIAVYNKP